jgi:hypothetical protein
LDAKTAMPRNSQARRYSFDRHQPERVLGKLGSYRRPAADVDQYDHEQQNETERDDDHLHEVGQRDGQHAAE